VPAGPILRGRGGRGRGGGREGETEREPGRAEGELGRKTLLEAFFLRGDLLGRGFLKRGGGEGGGGRRGGRGGGTGKDLGGGEGDGFLGEGLLDPFRHF